MENAAKSNKEKSTGQSKSTMKKMETIGDDLTAALAAIARNLEVGLTSIGQRFTTFDDPIKDAAEQISMTFENFDKRTSSLPRELRAEFSIQNKDITEKLEGLCESLEKYATQLTVTNRIQCERSKSLEKNLSDLSPLINSLYDSIKILEKILQPKKKQKKEERLVEITNESLTEFSRQYRLINENLEELFKNTGKILSQVSVNIRRQSELNQSLVKNTTYLCENIFSMRGSFDVMEKAMEKVIQSEEQMAEQSKQFAQFSAKVDSAITQLLEGFQDLKAQNELLVKQNEILTDYLKYTSKSGTTNKKSNKRRIDKN